MRCFFHAGVAVAVAVIGDEDVVAHLANAKHGTTEETSPNRAARLFRVNGNTRWRNSLKGKNNKLRH